MWVSTVYSHHSLFLWLQVNRVLNTAIQPPISKSCRYRVRCTPARYTVSTHELTTCTVQYCSVPQWRIGIKSIFASKLYAVSIFHLFSPALFPQLYNIFFLYTYIISAFNQPLSLTPTHCGSPHTPQIIKYSPFVAHTIFPPHSVHRSWLASSICPWSSFSPSSMIVTPVRDEAYALLRCSSAD